MKTRTSKAIGVAVGAAAIVTVGSAGRHRVRRADHHTRGRDSRSAGVRAATPSRRPVPNFKGLANVPVSNALASIPDVSTFSQAISGQLNPAVNVASVFDNGPYVIFAPTNEAFAKLPPEQLQMLRADPAALTRLVYYHAFLGLLGPDDVKGQRPTQEGTEIEVTGSGGDIAGQRDRRRSSAAVSRRRTPGSTSSTRCWTRPTAPAPITPTSTSATRRLDGDDHHRDHACDTHGVAARRGAGCHRPPRPRSASALQ